MWRTRDANLADQLRHALTSAALNTAEADDARAAIGTTGRGTPARLASCPVMLRGRIARRRRTRALFAKTRDDHDRAVAAGATLAIRPDDVAAGTRRA